MKLACIFQVGYFKAIFGQDNVARCMLQCVVISQTVHLSLFKPHPSENGTGYIMF